MADRRAGTRLIIKGISILAACGVLIALDQFTKALAVKELYGREPFVLLSGILELRYVENTGAAFGILKGGSLLFFVIAALVSLVLFYLLMKLPEGRRYMPLKLTFIFIISGALGNLIDRVRLSYVVDFIYFRLIDFPVFNVADIYITCSCAALVLLLIFYYKDDELKLL